MILVSPDEEEEEEEEGEVVGEEDQVLGGWDDFFKAVFLGVSQGAYCTCRVNKEW